MPSPARTLLAAGLAVTVALLLGIGCSLRTFEQQDCESDDVCVLAFGAGSECTAGMCSRSTACNSDQRCLEIAAGSTCESGRCSPPMVCSDDGECIGSFGLGSTCGPGFCTGSTPCAATADCTARFGWTSACEDGICVEVPPDERCRITTPSDLFDSDAHNDRVVIGQLFNRSQHAIEGRAAQTVIRSINGSQETGGIQNRLLGLIQCDQGSLVDTQEITAYLGRIGVPVIVGAMDSDATEAAFAEAARHRVTLVTPAAGAPRLTSLNEFGMRASPGSSRTHPGLLFRTVPTDDEQVRRIAEQFIADGKRRIAILFRAGAYGQGIESLMLRELQRLDPGDRTIVVDAFSYGTTPERANDELAGRVNQIAGVQPDLVLVASPATLDYVQLLTLISDENAHSFWQDAQLWFTDVAYNRQLRIQIDAASAALFPNIRGSRPAPQDTRDPVFSLFLNAYEALHGNRQAPLLTAYAATTHDATWLAALGIGHMLATSDSSDPAGIRVARGIRLALTGDTDPIPLERSALPRLLDPIIEGEPFSILGASGPLRINPTTNELATDNVRIEFWRLANPGKPGCREEARACFPDCPTDAPPCFASCDPESESCTPTCDETLLPCFVTLAD